MSADRLRIGDAERERAAADLGEHYGEGRLTQEEYAERLDAIWSARTRADLMVLFHDLPQSRATLERQRREHEQRSRQLARARRWQAIPLFPIAIGLIVLSVVFHKPFWLLIFAVWFLLAKMRHRHRLFH